MFRPFLQAQNYIFNPSSFQGSGQTVLTRAMAHDDLRRLVEVRNETTNGVASSFECLGIYRVTGTNAQTGITDEYTLEAVVTWPAYFDS